MSIRARRSAEPATASPHNSLEFQKAQLVCATCVFLIALAVYVGTLAPTVTFVDSGELIVAAKNLGVAHPPGTPFYVPLAHLFTLLPIGNLALRVNFASALFAALAAATTSLLVIEILRRNTDKALSGQAKDLKSILRTNKRAAEQQALTDSFRNSPINPAHLAKGSSPTRLAGEFRPAVIAGLLLTFSRTLWSFATVAEVYTLNTLL